MPHVQNRNSSQSKIHKSQSHLSLKQFQQPSYSRHNRSFNLTNLNQERNLSESFRDPQPEPISMQQINLLHPNSKSQNLNKENKIKYLQKIKMGGDKGDVGMVLKRNSIYTNFEVNTVLKQQEEYKPKPKAFMDSTPTSKVPLIKRSIKNSN